MNVNPYWVGMTCALSQYPGVQWLIKRAREQEEQRLRRERLSRETQETQDGLKGVLQVATAQQAREISKQIGKVKRQWHGASATSPQSLPRPIGRKPNSIFTRKPSLDPSQVPVGERTSDNTVTFFLRADKDGELSTGIKVRRGQHLTISVEGVCPLSPTLLVNPGGIEIKRGRIHGNPIVRPDAAYPHVPCGSIAARLPTTSAWPVRGKWAGPAPASGVLHLAINDVPGQYKDNRGKQGEIVVLAVTVEVS